MNMQVMNSKAPGGFRPLTAEEIMAVSGGGDLVIDEEGSVIVVTGPKTSGITDTSFIPSNIFGGGYDLGGLTFGGLTFGDGDSGGGSVGDLELPHHCSSSNYPAGFDHALDDAVDDLAARLAAEINAKPDVDRREYGAIIWRDANGNLHRTMIAEGNANSVNISQIWLEIDFASGGQVVAILHSHPTEYNAGSTANPIWAPSSSSGTLSSIDFDTLIDNGTRAQHGYDSTNYRSYLVHNGDLKEYYAFDQDTSMVGAGGQATWAIPASDTGMNQEYFC